MDINGIAHALQQFLPDLPLKVSEPMTDHTTFRIGGPADLWCRPVCIEQLIQVLRFAAERELPYFVIGNGSNLLVRDKGLRCLVVETTALDRIELCSEDELEAECGASLTRAAVFAQSHALTGLEFAFGIPGTVGGAVYMNAGAYGGEMKHCVTETDYLDAKGVVHTLKGVEHLFQYRKSFFTETRDTVILKTRIKLAKGDPQQIHDRMMELKRRRQESQPLQYPSAGSFFKRPEGFFAGKLISDCGLKGCACGGAQVSEKHAGFIINQGDATCRDVLLLMEDVRNRVQAQFGVSLEPEVKIIGED